MSGNYWLTPDWLYEQFDREFHFDNDPCPFPRPEHYNGLIEPWGSMNYVNPPYRKQDCVGGNGPTAFVKKALDEHRWHGSSSVLVMPVHSYLNMLVTAGAEIRPLGRVAWLDAETREPWSNPQHVAAFVLRGKP